MSQHCRKQQKHGKRRQDEPECGLGISSYEFIVSGVAPQPYDREYGYERKRCYQPADGRVALGRLRNNEYENAREGRFESCKELACPEALVVCRDQVPPVPVALSNEV
jgi:hypothetical protein